MPEEWEEYPQLGDYPPNDPSLDGFVIFINGKAKGKRTSANTARGKNCVFGLLVNKVQVEQCGSVQQLEQKRQPAPGPSTSCTSGGVVDGSTDVESENDFVGKH